MEASSCSRLSVPHSSLPSLLPCATTQNEQLSDRPEKGRGVLHFAPNPLSLKPHQIPCFPPKSLIFLDKHGTLNQRVQGSNPCTPTKHSCDNSRFSKSSEKPLFHKGLAVASCISAYHSELPGACCMPFPATDSAPSLKHFPTSVASLNRDWFGRRPRLVLSSRGAFQTGSKVSSSDESRPPHSLA